MKKKQRILSLLLAILIAVFVVPFASYAGDTRMTEEEKIRQIEDVNRILKEVGVGFATPTGSDEIEDRMIGKSVYISTLQKNIGAIDIVQYNDGTSGQLTWKVLNHWTEGRFGMSDGTPTYCANPMMTFKRGNKIAKDASQYYNKQTIQMIAALFYYFDQNKCSGISKNDEYLFKQCAVWIVLNEVHGWYKDVAIETGNGLNCGQNHYLSEHFGKFRSQGVNWARDNYMHFPDASGIIYEGDGQPLSQWRGTYQPKGYLSISKKSANEEVTNNNQNYSLAGAKFHVYSDANMSSSSLVGTLVTDANGKTPKLELRQGYYYVKEVESPKGYIAIEGGQTVYVKAGNSKVFYVAEPPKFATSDLLIKKIDADTISSVGQGDGTLQGAHFRVKYYAGMWSSNVNPEKLGVAAKREWIFETDKDGLCKYDMDHFVSGDALYVDHNNKYAMPYGTFTVEEIKPPEGYHLTSGVVVKQVTENAVVTITFPERVIELQLKKKQEQSNIAIANAVFTHVKPDGTEEQVATDKNGILKLKGLRSGEHRLREKEVMDGYLLNQNEIVFFVDQNHKIQIRSTVKPEYGDVKINFTRIGNIEIEMEDRVAPFALRLHKKNQMGELLLGAEFTLYQDKQCQQMIASKVTDAAGHLQFARLSVGKYYYLKETKAPQGYYLDLDANGNERVYEIFVESEPANGKFVVYVDGKPYDTTADAADGFWIAGNAKSREVHAAIINETSVKLPETGAMSMFPIVTTGIMLCLLSILWKREGK